VPAAAVLARHRREERVLEHAHLAVRARADAVVAAAAADRARAPADVELAVRDELRSDGWRARAQRHVAQRLRLGELLEGDLGVERDREASRP
jgi:hypothetical protein